MIIQTKNTRYFLMDIGDGAFLVSGHKVYCPRPYKVRLVSEPVEGESLMWEYVDDMPEYVRAKNHRIPGVITSSITQIIRGS